MRRPLASLAFLLAAAACGSSESSDPTGPREDMQAYDVADEAAPLASDAAPPPAARAPGASSGPNVAPTAAPGVAFNYRYAFRLSAPKIAEVQEAHARACEQLGVARCRITGMRYRVVNERDISAMLAFKLEPSIARRFGQLGVETVVQAEGMLVESEISGTDVGTSIRAAGRNIAELTEELERIEARLRGGGLRAAERQSLEYEAQQLRQQIRANQASREQQQESLATTPMLFEYGSGDLVPGFDTRPSLRRAAERAGDNFVDGVVLLFIIVVTVLPWALAGLLGWLAYRGIRRAIRRREDGEAEAEA